jgi:hypothetical protein
MLSLAGALVAALPAVAFAQPVDPYADPPTGTTAPTPTPAPTPQTPATPQTTSDPEVDAAVSASLVARARTLDADGDTQDARQLVLEALVRTPGDADAKALLATLDRKLGLVHDEPVKLPIDTAPLPPEYQERDDEPVEQPGPTGYVRPSGMARYGGAVVGGAVAGGLFADVVTGLDGTTEDDVLGGVVLGALGGGLLGYAFNKNSELTAGDHALIASMEAWGLVGGLTFAMAIDPPEGEAYSLNGVLGITGGFLIGHIAARRTDVSTARMPRVNLAAMAGALAPWLLYAATADADTHNDEQAFGFLSPVGLLGGAYLGFRWTRNMAPGTTPLEENAPTALFHWRRLEGGVGRGSRGGWATGGIGLKPVRGSRGATLSLLSGTW